jgi:hypothetical protein
MTSLEEMNIYQNYVDLFYYTYLITEKFPKYEKIGLVVDIKEVTKNGFEDIINAQKEFNLNKRLNYLNHADAELKVIKVFIRISYKFKYISSRNYGAWSNKLLKVNNQLFGWIKACLKQ